MIRLLACLFALILCLGTPASGLAREDQSAGPPPSFRASDLPVPRFVSLRSDRVFARTGPALRYPVRWVYQRDRLPVEIVEEFDTWRKIRDRDGEEGWVHQSMLSGERSALVTGETVVFARSDPDAEAPVTFRLEPGAVVALRRSEGGETGWCQISTGGFRGWVERKSLWGIYPEEELH